MEAAAESPGSSRGSLLLLGAALCGVTHLARSPYWRGWWQTLTSALSLCCNRGSFAANHTAEEFPCADGEVAVVWWPSSADGPDGTPAERRQTRRGRGHLWVLLPGGMCNAAAGYVDDAMGQGLFDGDSFCAFHNPGIESRMVKRPSPPGLTETRYLEEFILASRERGFGTVSVVGFSAGSMLALAMAARGDALDRARLGAQIAAGLAVGDRASPAASRVVSSAVAVNGPDKIRSVFEAHRNSWLRLDIYFSILLWSILRQAGVQETVPQLHFPWLGGWEYMVWITEQCFGQPWAEMEAELWACDAGMRTPLSTPVLRVLCRNDPVIPYEGVDEALFENLDRVIVEDEGGHCGVLRHHPYLAKEIREWELGVRHRPAAAARNGR